MWGFPTGYVRATQTAIEELPMEGRRRSPGPSWIEVGYPSVRITK